MAGVLLVICDSGAIVSHANTKTLKWVHIFQPNIKTNYPSLLFEKEEEPRKVKEI